MNYISLVLNEREFLKELEKLIGKRLKGFRVDNELVALYLEFEDGTVIEIGGYDFDVYILRKGDMNEYRI